MKRIFIIAMILSVSTLGFAGYESDLVERMKIVETETQEIIDSGINMMAATMDLEETWSSEYEKIKKIIISELSPKEKSKFIDEEKKWAVQMEKSAKKEADESEADGGQIYSLIYSARKTELLKERAIELAKKYDSITNN